MQDGRITAKRSGRRARPRAVHYAAFAAWFAFCILLACAFWPGPGTSTDWTPVPGGPVVPGSALPSVTTEEATEVARLYEAVEKLRPLHGPFPQPGPHDWLASHPEPGQTFKQYLACRPTRARGTRNRLYVQPLGGFTAAERRIVQLTAEYMGIYFGLPAETLDDLPLSLVPDSGRRVHPSWGDRQLLTGYILKEMLRPRLPDDAAAYIAFTASDLWPGEGWNFVFGQATLRHRVAVWSIYRFGDPAAGEKGFARCLLRTMKVATHETGHMFSMHHCIAYACNMNGSNHLEEADRQPPWLCAECMPKVSWATGVDPSERYGRLEAFYREHSFERIAAFYRRAVEGLQ